MKSIFIFFCLFFQFGAQANLTQEEAIQRRKQVKSVAYSLSFFFKEIEGEFDGVVTLDIELNDLTKPLRIDLTSKEVKEVSINGVKVNPTNLTSDSFDIDPSNLQEKISLTITYTGVKGSSEFISFNDPDGSEYFFTNLEPYGAHSIFPCFDQPDIKATYSLVVKAPTKWKIIANELPQKVTKGKEYSVHTFRKTPPFSSYLFFIGGGPFVEWKDQHKGLPLTLYARKSLASHIDHKEIFRVTKKGLDFFTDYFKTPMPFSKHGQLFVPNFVSGGMENPGAVTLNERFIFKSKPDISLKIMREDLILHELAHMWFGNLVTMQWWNDLWLNEAFASYSASLGLTKALGRKTAELNTQSRKYNAYKEDMYSTSHPVYAQVPNALSAFASFDSITYSKGASILNQLHNIVGDEVFQKGLVFYFKNYAYQNTIFLDFISAFEKYHEKPLKEWADRWLKTRGLNQITPTFTCENNRLKTFTLKMTPTPDQLYYTHKTGFGFYSIKQNKISVYHREDALLNQAETSLTHLDGKPCPDFVFPNEEDTDYALYFLDEKSLKNAKFVLAHHPDPKKRYLLWNILALSVRFGHLSQEAFFEAALEAFKAEKEGVILNLITGTLSNRKTYSFREVFNIFSGPAQIQKYAPQLESVVFNRLINLPKDSTLRNDFNILFALIVHSNLGQERILQYLKRAKTGTEEFNQETRWRMLIALSRNGYPKTFQLASDELKRDKTETGKRFNDIVKTAYPSLKTKEEMWNYFLKIGSISPDTAYDAAEYVHSPDRPEMSIPFISGYFEFLENNDWIANNQLVDFYFSRFFPTYACSLEVLKKSKISLKNAKQLSPKVIKIWTQHNEELELCVQRKSTSD